MSDKCQNANACLYAHLFLIGCRPALINGAAEGLRWSVITEGGSSLDCIIRRVNWQGCSTTPASDPEKGCGYLKEIPGQNNVKSEK